MNSHSSQDWGLASDSSTPNIRRQVSSDPLYYHTKVKLVRQTAKGALVKVRLGTRELEVWIKLSWLKQEQDSAYAWTPGLNLNIRRILSEL